MQNDTEQLGINTLRVLSAEAITTANSGHPGICLGAAPVAFTLYSRFLKFDPQSPDWENRDRFVLSAGHGSAMLYALLHLFGYDVTAQDLAEFRKLGSKTPGHPERGVTDGVDASTGPLGQGIANAVGLALAEAHLAAVFNKKGFPIVDHYTYALCGDGCLEEGISYEACSFAGAHKLGKLILLYDKNDISIEGDTSVTFNEDTAGRFAAQGWHVEQVEDANDVQALDAAVRRAQADERPSIIICKSVIGFGSPLAGSAKIHGSPLDKNQLEQTKAALGISGAPFETPQSVKDLCAATVERNKTEHSRWTALFEKYAQKYPELAEKYRKYFTNDYGVMLDALAQSKPEATRISGGKILNEIADRVPNLLSGSADLSPSTKTDIKNAAWFSPADRTGRNIHFGIREHAMAAICNGIALHGGLRVVCSTFFTFSDYMKGAMRMSAIMRLPVIYVLTHDSIGVGEDGPTHQPIEQLAGLRAVPDLNVFRPCDYSETAAAFEFALESPDPTAIVLSRQDLPQYGKGEQAEYGGYIIDDCESKPDVLLIATGSEVGLMSEAKKLMRGNGINARVISVPCAELFDRQSDGYKQLVMPDDIPVRIVAEAAATLGWHKYTGSCGDVLGMATFGASGDANELFRKFGFTPENVADIAERRLIGRCKKQ